MAILLLYLTIFQCIVGTNNSGRSGRGGSGTSCGILLLLGGSLTSTVFTNGSGVTTSHARGKNGLRIKCPRRLSRPQNLLGCSRQGIAKPILVKEGHLPLGRVDVDIDVRSWQLQGQVDKGLGAAGQRVDVYGFDRPAEGCRFHEPIVDEEHKGRGGFRGAEGAISDQTEGSVGEGESSWSTVIIIIIIIFGAVGVFVCTTASAIFTIPIRSSSGSSIIVLCRFHRLILLRGLFLSHCLQRRQAHGIDISLGRTEGKQLLRHGRTKDVTNDIFRRPLGLLTRDAFAIGTAVAIGGSLLRLRLRLLLRQLEPLLLECPDTGQTGRVQVGLPALLPAHQPDAPSRLVDGVPLGHVEDAGVLLGLLPRTGEGPAAGGDVVEQILNRMILKSGEM